ncbi:hypothetical protein GCM10020229_03550 [Kitasatospora albolonga]|uniref:hypothetical protein n=1 Tax=Kitasatospora albolonga TaxID=68173 RepID=UPI0031E74989
MGSLQGRHRLDKLAALFGVLTLLPQICRDRWLFRVLSAIVGILAAFLGVGFTFSGAAHTPWCPPEMS